MPIVPHLKNLLSPTTLLPVFIDRTFVKIVIIALLYALGTYGLGIAFGRDISLSAVLYISIVKFTWWGFIIGFLVLRFFTVLFFHEHPKNIRWSFLIALKNDLKFYLYSNRMTRGAFLIALCLVFFSLFTSAKSMVSVIQPFSWDPLFSELDSVIHFGVLPHQILHGLMGGFVTTMILSFFYKFWFIAKFGVVFWQAFSMADDKRREHFFIAMILSWVLIGTVGAMAFSSAGPCFYHLVYPDKIDPYASLMTHMGQAHILGMEFEYKSMDHLWERYLDGGVSMFSGISAFPSMHVSLATIFMLIGWRTNKVMGWFFTVYLILIQVGSVYLGWHYAVDGYFAIPATMLIWWFTGKYLVTEKKEVKV